MFARPGSLTSPISGGAGSVRPQSRRGNCWENAVAESFFSSLKKERIKKRIYKTRDLARAEVFDYIEMFYNPTRRHSHLGGVSPEAFESASNEARWCPRYRGHSRRSLKRFNRSTPGGLYGDLVSYDA